MRFLIVLSLIFVGWLPSASATDSKELIGIKIKNMNFWMRITTSEVSPGRELLINFRSLDDTHLASAIGFYTRSSTSILGWKKQIDPGFSTIYFDFEKGIIFLKQPDFISPTPIGYVSPSLHGYQSLNQEIREFTKEITPPIPPFSVLAIGTMGKYREAHLIIAPTVSKDGRSLQIDATRIVDSIYDKDFKEIFVKAVTMNSGNLKLCAGSIQPK